MKLSVIDITYGTRVNGPGRRNIVHVAGCRIRCPGCFSKHTWEKSAGKVYEVAEVLELLLKDNPEGVAISGGEPLEQAGAVSELARLLWLANLSKGVVLFTGVAHHALNNIPEWAEIKKHVDLVVSGPYDQQLAVTPVRGMLSSSNQRLLYMSYKITPDMLSTVPSVEVQITKDGGKILGFPGERNVSLKND